MSLSLAKNVIVDGADNRPPMLDKTNYSSWASRMLLYIKGKEHGKLLVDSVLNRPFQYGTMVEPGNETTPATIYTDLIDEEKIRESVDIKATNIVLQGSELSLQEQESKLYDDFDTLTSMPGEIIHSYYMRFPQLINDMHIIGMTMKPLQVNTKQHETHANEVRLSRQRYPDQIALVDNSPTCLNPNQYYLQLPSATQQYYSPPAPQCSYDAPIVQQSQYQPQVVTNSSVVHQQPYQVPALQQSYQAPAIQQPMQQSSSTELDSELVVPSFNLTDDPIANLNKLMAFVTTTFTPRFPQTNNQLRTSSNPQNQATIQDGRVTVQTTQGRQSQGSSKGLSVTTAVHQQPYQVPALQQSYQAPAIQQPSSTESDSGLFVPYFNPSDDPIANLNKLMAFAVIEEMSSQVAKCNKVQQENLIFHETLTAELERYKEQVKLFEQRQKFKLNDREKYTDGQIRQVIVDRNAKVADFEKQIHSLKLQLNATVESHKTLSTTVECLKKEPKQKEDKYIDEVINLQNKNKALDNVVYKIGQSTQTMHMLTKPQAFYDESHKIALGYQIPFYLSQARRKVPTLYGGHTNVKTYVALSVTDTEETLELAKESTLKMIAKQNDPSLKEKKVNIVPVDYVALNKLSEHFVKHFVPQKQLSAEQAFWLPISQPVFVKSSIPSEQILKKEIPRELSSIRAFEKDAKPFAQTLKEYFQLFEHGLCKEMKAIFNQMEIEVSKFSVDKKYFEIEKKELSLDNDRLYAPEFKEFFIINELQAQLKAKNVSIEKLKEHIANIKGKNFVDSNNMAAHVDYLKHTQENADILHEIVKHARDLRPLDSELTFSCKFVTLIQELLVYVSATCPSSKHVSDKLVVVTPMNKTRKVESKQFKTNKVKDQPRIAKSSLNNTNRVSKIVCNANVKHSVLNANSELICATCHECMFDAIHDLCVSGYLNGVNAHVKSKSVKSRSAKSKKKKIWKPTGKVYTNVGYSWKPTGQIFTIDGNICPLIRIISTNIVPPRKSISTTPVLSDSEMIRLQRLWGYGDYLLGNVTILWVYYVEGLGHNLFFVGQFCDSDLEVAFRKHMCYVQNLDGTDLLSGSRDTNLYTISLNDMLKSYLICLLSKASKTKSWLWHRRLSYLNFGKSKKSSHKPKVDDNNQEKLYLLHIDLCGPMRVEIINEKKNILVIVDDYSRFAWVKFFRSKDKAPEVIIKCLKQIQVRMNATVRNIRIDNRTEFMNQTLKDYYENVESHIKHRLLYLWAEAVSIACYTQNHSLIRLRYNKTPYELMHEKKPDLSFLHVVGSLCYPTNDSEDLGKLKSKADISIFVGYAPVMKAFRIYNKRTWQIMETIHVTFDELTTMASEQFSSGPAP
ncbi:retrovirus-related pol polyprotein from transposon TNT 1-94 [Tanacetum coccineum]